MALVTLHRKSDGASLGVNPAAVSWIRENPDGDGTILHLLSTDKRGGAEVLSVVEPLSQVGGLLIE